mmetsp:Transcript_102601/g.330956  ORF Transcript_102601/g.330956 Transcript_102601/m.330956 type:complete len:232 (-) Transcript_102601:175-870(-)
MPSPRSRIPASPPLRLRALSVAPSPARPPPRASSRQSALPRVLARPARGWCSMPTRRLPPPRRTRASRPERPSLGASSAGPTTARRSRLDKCSSGRWELSRTPVPMSVWTELTACMRRSGAFSRSVARRSIESSSSCPWSMSRRSAGGSIAALSAPRSTSRGWAILRTLAPPEIPGGTSTPCGRCGSSLTTERSGRPRRTRRRLSRIGSKRMCERSWPRNRSRSRRSLRAT